jgi:hypothetical protein
LAKAVKRNTLAVLGATAGIAAMLAGFYFGFFAAASRIPPGPVLGLIGAALGVGCVLGCAGVAFFAHKWAHRRPNKRESTPC